MSSLEKKSTLLMPFAILTEGFMQGDPSLLTFLLSRISAKLHVGNMRKMFAIEVATATSCILRRLAGN